MNFLAHLHLSAQTPASMLGGVAADFATPAEVAALPPDVREGVRLHRLIDAFTDRHPVVQGSVRRVAGPLGWFAGIAVDLYYDHVLARDWPAFAAEPLAAFAARAYAALAAHLPHAPPAAARFLRRFIADDRLTRYATVGGLTDTLARVSDRIAERIPGRAVRLEDHAPGLVARDADLTADFRAFYPQLVAYAEAVKAGA